MESILINYILFFIIYSILGWLCEVCYRSAVEGVFVNSGFLNGTYCPIYGFGMLLLISLLKPIEDKIIILFLGSIFITTLLEGAAGWLLHKLFKIRWWDYSDMPYNINGYVCPAFSLLWGLGSCIAVRLIHPAVINFANYFTLKTKEYFVFTFLLIMIVDEIVSIATVIKLNQQLRAIDKIAKRLRKVSDKVAERVGNIAIEIDEYGDETLEELQCKLNTMKSDFVNNKMKRYSRLFKAFPEQNHDKYAKLVEELIEEYANQKTRKE